jgi:hypothetical protein
MFRWKMRSALPDFLQRCNVIDWRGHWIEWLGDCQASVNILWFLVPDRFWLGGLLQNAVSRKPGV